ncbi:Transposase [Candidatus Burkholderia brachyanthoides]|nr:Transposase [Candidatus Burkholderia brachyanthoides]
MKPYRDLSDEEWQMVASLLPELRPRSELRGRPLANARAVLNDVLWVMYSGASWSTMPRKYPLYQTCHRRFKAWHESGVLLNVMAQLFGPAGESLYALMTLRMRVPAELPFQDAAETYADVREIAAANTNIGTHELQTPARRAA